MSKTLSEADAIAQLAAGIDAGDRQERAADRAERMVQDRKGDSAPSGRASDADALTLDDAVAAVSGQLEREDKAVADELGPEDDPEPDDSDAQADADDSEPDDDVQEDDSESEDDEDVDPDDVDELHTVKVDGKEFQVSTQELRSGYMRHQAFTRKTQQLAEQRKAAEATRLEAVQRGQQYESELLRFKGALDAVEQAFYQNMDPEGRANLANMRAQGETRLQQLKAEREAVMQEYQAAAAKEALETFHTNAGRFDSEAQDAAETALVSYLHERGVSDDEIRGVAASPIGLDIVHKAMLYDKATGGKFPGKAKAKTSPSLKAGSKPPTSRGQQQSRGQRQLQKRFKATGDLNDAVALVASMIDID